MKTARKAILLVLCVILLVVASVMGTLAYLTDTEAVTNTFTVGKVGITLDETDVDETGIKDGDTQIQRFIHQAHAQRFINLFAEGHGAQAEGGNLNAGAGKIAIVHN